jgi:chemotaxis protein CheC
MEENGELQSTQGFTSEREQDLGILLELGNIGTGHATTALSEIVNESITVEVPRLHIVPSHLVPKIYGKHDQITSVTYMQLRGTADCDILLALDAQEAKKIAAMMAMAPSPEDIDPETEASAIKELGSIMIGAFLSAIADFIDIELVPMSPHLVTDSFDAIIDGFAVQQALVSDVALVFDTRFKRSSNSAEGTLLMFPSVELQKLLINKSREWLSWAGT